MILIDGVKYHEWTPKSEEEFEQVVKEHAQDIFGEQSIYFDLKKKLTTKAGIGSIPDGYVIGFREPPCWYICEVELHTHPLYEHIVPQITKFINGVKSFETQREIINALDREISGDPFKEALVINKTGSREIYRFISNLVSRPPVLAILIDQRTKELEEVCDSLPIEVKIVEFKTFAREGIGLAVHAHLFEPLYRPIISTELAPPEREIPVESMKLKVWRSYMEYEYIGIWKKHREFFPQYGATIELITDDGDIFRAKVGKSPAGSTELLGLRDWYRKNPDLKEGDLILITPVEPMKKYRIQTRRRQQ